MDRQLLVEDNKISTLYWAEVDRAITAAGGSFWAEIKDVHRHQPTLKDIYIEYDSIAVRY